MRKRGLFYSLLGCGAMMFAAACSDDTNPPIPDTQVQDDMSVYDMGVDGMQPDTMQPDTMQPDTLQPDTMQPDTMQPDMAVADMNTTDMAADMAADAMQPDAMLPDAMVPDAMVPDAMVPDAMVSDASAASATVMYLTGSTSTALAPYQIKLDGTGKTAVPGLPATIDPYYTYIRGSRQEYAVVNRNRPAPLIHVDNYYRPTYLPNNIGHLYHYITSSPAGRGFFVVRPTGTVDLLDFVAGSSNSTATYYYYTGMSDDGKILAAVAGYNNSSGSTVKLLRTDGQNFGTSSSKICDITPTATPKITYVRYYSFTFGEKYFYFVTRDTASTSQYYLYRAPLDCSAKATKVTLPNVGGAAPVDIEDYTHRSEDGKKIFINAGFSASNADVLMVDDATGTVTNITDSPADYEYPGYYYGYYSTKMDVSPKGTHVAYTKKASSKYDLYVRPTDKSAPAVHLTNATDFASDYDSVMGVQFVNEDDLFFWVGPTTSYGDMFHYKISTKVLTQITKSGGTTKPYSGATTAPTLRTYGGWYAPNGKYFYQMVYHYKSGTDTKSNIQAIDTATGAIKYITTNQYVYYSTSNIEAAETGSKVFFYAETHSSSNDENLYVFDQNTASAPQKLTSFTGTSYIRDIAPNKDGSLVAFGQGTSSSTTNQNMYVVQVLATPVVTKLTTTTGYVSDMKWFTADNKSVVYGLGSSSYRGDIRVQSITGGTAKILDAVSANYTSSMMVW